MDSRFVPTDIEPQMYDLWEKRGLLKPKSDKKPFTILMPPLDQIAGVEYRTGMNLEIGLGKLPLPCTRIDNKGSINLDLCAAHVQWLNG